MRRLAACLAAASLLVGGGTPVLGADVQPGYLPVDRDERGLWMQMDEQERLLKTSSFVIRDAALNAYVRGVFCRTVGQDECKDVRLYLVRIPHFNASMTPNGMLQVWSGTLLRVPDEAQLAAVLGHEYTHYKSKHALKLFREMKNNMAAANFLMMTGPWGLLADLAIVSSLYQYSRDNETEADAGGLALMARAGYDPTAAAQIWERDRQEREATAAARNTKARYGNGGIFADHPNSLERMNRLRALAAAAVSPTAVRNEAAYRSALSPWWPLFIDDQIKLNDFGGTELLLGQLASGGWTSPLLFARGELYRSRGRPEDLRQAADYYRQAATGADAPVEVWRGLGLALLRDGDRAAGETALKTYLQKKPDAPDRAMMQMLAGVQ